MIEDDRLEKALLWVYIAQHVRMEPPLSPSTPSYDRKWEYIAQRRRDWEWALNFPAGVLEENCEDQLTESVYQNLIDRGYITENSRYRKESLHLFITTAAGNSKAKLLINAQLSQHKAELHDFLQKLPLSFLAFFAKELLPLDEFLDYELHENEYMSDDWGRGDLNTRTGKEKHLCLLKNSQILEKRNALLDKLVALNLAVNNVDSYAFKAPGIDGTQHLRGSAYVVAPEAISILQDYVTQHFKGEIFDSSFEPYHRRYHELLISGVFDAQILNPLAEHLLKADVSHPEPSEKSKKSNRTAYRKETEVVCPQCPLVRTRRGWKKGKGYSILELTSSGLSLSVIKTREFSIDKRRKTCHESNVNFLKIIHGKIE